MGSTPTLGIHVPGGQVMVKVAPGAIHPEIQTSADDPGGNLPGQVTLTFTRARALPFTQYPDPVTTKTAYVATSYLCTQAHIM